MQTHQIKGFAQAGEHAKAQHIDLKDPQRVDVVLVPANHRAVLHCGVFDGHQLVQPAFGDDKAAHMLA